MSLRTLTVLPVHLLARFVSNLLDASLATDTCIMYVIQLTKPQIVCSPESLFIITSVLLDDESGSGMLPKMSSVYFSNKESYVVMNVTGLPAREKLYSNFLILSQDGDVADAESTHFSE